MANDFNSITITGRVGRDPEVRNFQGGGAVCSFSVAVGNTWGKGDDRKEETTWFRVAIFNERSITFAENYVKKGDLVLVRGQMKSRKYTNNDGNEVETWELVYRFDGDLMKLSRDEDRRGGDDRGGDRRDDRGSDRGRDDRGRGDDRRGSADRGRGDDRRGGDDRRRDDSRGSSRGGGGGGDWTRGGGGRSNADLDDDIPF